MTFIIETYQLDNDLKIIAQASVGERFIIEQGKITGGIRPDSFTSNAIQNGLKWFNNNVYGEDQSTKRAIGIICDLITQIYIRLININSTNLSTIEVSNRVELIKNCSSTLARLEQIGIPNFITTIENDWAHVFSTSEEVKSQQTAKLNELIGRIQYIQEEAKKISIQLNQGQDIYVKKLLFVPHKATLSSFISWIRDPNVTHMPNVSHFAVFDVKEALEKEFSPTHIDSIFLRYGLSERYDLSGMDIQALYIGLSATMTREDLNVFLMQPENNNSIPEQVVAYYHSLKTSNLPLDNCPYKKMLEIDLGLLKCHHLFEKYQVQSCKQIENSDKSVGYIEMLGLYFARYFSHDYQATDKKPFSLENKIMFRYPTLRHTVLVELQPHYIDEFQLFTLCAIPITPIIAPLSIFCRKMGDLNPASILSLSYWWAAKPAETISSSKDTIGLTIFNTFFNKIFFPKSSILELVGFENECHELIEHMKNQIDRYSHEYNHHLHERTLCFSEIHLQKCDSIPPIDNDTVATVNYYTSISHLR